jgi:hypothetical protein
MFLFRSVKKVQKSIENSWIPGFLGSGWEYGSPDGVVVCCVVAFASEVVEGVLNTLRCGVGADPAGRDVLVPVEMYARSSTLVPERGASLVSFFYAMSYRLVDVRKH